MRRLSLWARSKIIAGSMPCAKQLLERVLHAYGLEEGLNYSIIRPFNFIGPRID